MSKRTLPALAAPGALQRVTYEPPPSVLQRYTAGLRGQLAEGEDNVIDILDFIGSDWWTGQGVSARKVRERLKEIGAGDVVVNLNSPGGDFFEGHAIYEALRQHKGEVTVRVLGMAASVAATIAMAGDRVEIGPGAFFMIHNVWGVAVGDRNDFRAVADVYEQFDAASAGLYVARTGLEQAAVARMMDRETWLGADAAIEKGFADAKLESGKVAAEPGDAGQQAAGATVVQRLESALARAGMPRGERRAFIKEVFSAMPSAGEPGTPSAADDGASIDVQTLARVADAMASLRAAVTV